GGGGGGGSGNRGRYHNASPSKRLSSVGSSTNSGEEAEEDEAAGRGGDRYGDRSGGRSGDRRRGHGKAHPGGGGLPLRNGQQQSTRDRIVASRTRMPRVASPLSRGSHHGPGAVPPEAVPGNVESDAGSSWAEDDDDDTWDGAGRGGG
ncbi:unnamed protein product, partial [Laminaria digitata]